MEILLAERYDRVSQDGRIYRIHQEHIEIRKVNKDNLSILAEQVRLKSKAFFDTYFEMFAKIGKVFEIIRNDSAHKNHSDLINAVEQNISKRNLK